MNFLKKTSIYFISNILNALAPFLLLPFLTRCMTTAEYGQIAIFQTLITGLAAFVGVNTIGAAGRRFFDNVNAKSLTIYNSSCFAILGITTLILIVLVSLFSGVAEKFSGLPLDWIYIAVVIAACNFVIQFRLNQWQVREMPISYAVIQVSQSALLFILSFIFVVHLKQGAQGRVDAVIWVSLLFLIVTAVLLFKDKLIGFYSFSMQSFNDALRYGIPLVPHIFGMFLLTSIDRFFINSYLGAGSAGIYMVAVQLSMALVIIFDAFNKAFVPWLFRVLANDNKIAKLKIVKITYLYFCVLLVGAVFSFFIGPPVIVLVAGDKYTDASSIIGWLCLGQCFQGMYLMVTNYLFYTKETIKLSVVSGLCSVVSVVLLYIYLPNGSISTAAKIFAFSMCLRFIGTWWLALKTRLMPWCLG